MQDMNYLDRSAKKQKQKQNVSLCWTLFTLCENDTLMTSLSISSTR